LPDQGYHSSLWRLPDRNRGPQAENWRLGDRSTGESILEELLSEEGVDVEEGWEWLAPTRSKQQDMPTGKAEVLMKLR
jgi:hypothetical protein